MFNNMHDVFKGKPVLHLKPKNYTKCGPGTKEWVEIWKAHPELQDEMLEFQKKGYIWCRDKEQRMAIVVCQKRDCKKPCPARDWYIPEGKNKWEEYFDENNTNK